MYSCNALYCRHCAQALIKMENECWACDIPIDPSKPVIHYKKEEEKIDAEILEKYQKRLQNKKDPPQE